jgi:hypothetical protein
MFITHQNAEQNNFTKTVIFSKRNNAETVAVQDRKWYCVLSGFRSGINVIFSFLGCYTA